MQRKVLFVREGTWGVATQEDEDRYREMIERIVREIKTGGSGADRDAPVATVETVETAEDAVRRLEQGDVDVLVFNSRSHVSTARELKKRFPRVKMVVMTGLIPKDEVIIVNKAWIHGDVIRQLFIDHA